MNCTPHMRYSRGADTLDFDFIKKLKFWGRLHKKAGVGELSLEDLTALIPNFTPTF